MKKLLLGIIVGLFAGGAGVWVILRQQEAQSGEKKDETKENSHVVHGTNGETFVKLDKEAQERAGLETAPLEQAELKPEIKAFGRVLDPAALAVAMTDIASARTQFEASSKELQRLNVLHTQNQNVSTRAVESAEATAQRDRIAAEAAQLRLLSTWGKALAGRKDLDAFIRQLVLQQAALVRVDVPPSQKLMGEPDAARVSLLSAKSPLPAEFVGPATSADAQTLGSGFLFVIHTNAAANTAVIAWLSSGGEVESGALVPRESIVRHEGEAFIYVQTGHEQFERKEIEIDRPLERGWFVPGLKPGTKVVIVGAQQLLSEELKGAGGGE